MKRNLSTAWLALLLASLAPQTHAMDENLRTCKHSTGVPMPADECALLQRLQVADEARLGRAAQQAEANRAAEAQWRLEREEKAALAKREHEARLAQDLVDTKRRQAAFDAEVAEEQRAEAVATRKAQARASARQVACGSDYLNPQIGMSIQRAQQCVGTFKVSAQINRADGIVTTYQGARTYLHVMDGRVISWGRH